MASVPANHPGEQRMGPTLYELEKTKYGSRQLEKQYEDILGPLSLFAQLPSEEVQETDDIKEERPVTPIEESIKTPPSTFKQLAKLIRRRVAAKPGLEHLTQDEQQTLAGVIMGEVNCIWPDIRRQVDDPFLTPEENKELQRRITVHIVTVCEQLFHHYVEKAKVLNSRGVFSEQANISRLKAQLSLDANKFLNILAIRRYIVADIRGNLSDSEEEDTVEPVITQDGFVPLSYKKLIECSRPKRKHGYRKTVEQEIKDMDNQMPPIQPQKALEYMPDVELMERALEDFEDEEEEEGEEVEEEEEKDDTIEEEKDEVIYEEPEEESVSHDSDSIQFCGERRREIPLDRPDSLPELHKDTFLEELGLERPSAADRPSSSVMIRKMITQDKNVEIKLTVKPSDRPATPDPKDVLKKDLQQLSVYTSMRDKARDEPMKEEEDLPPLLQAVDETERGETRREMLQRKMREMEQERLKKEAAERYKVTKPTHPQPATVTTKLRDKSVVRTSDIRVSERVQQGQVSLKLYKTVFNELVDEIDANTIKRMDSNLFRGQEINEVYNEIMKTLPTDHHSFDKDDFVELCADPKALHKTPLLAAANLTANKPGRVINQELCSINEPPWGENREVWCQSPIFNATFAQQNPSKPVQQASGATDDFTFGHSTNNFALGGLAQSLSGALDDQGLGQGQVLMDERNARSYASWLAWWKNTISSQDYIKYLSTQESDYLGVVFHFFDHEGASSTDDKSETDEDRLAQLAKERERQEKLVQLREQKSHFTEGMWNVGTITLGGLGKDPELEEELEDTSGSAVNSPSPQNFRRTHSGKVRMVRSVTSTPTEGAMLKVPGTGMSRNVSRASLQRGRVEVASPSVGSPETVMPTSQERLEAVWNSLQMPDHMRLDMAIKYSSNEYADKLIESLEAWEVATELILQREAILSNLEAFERFASDPDRFFQKGQRGSSVARLQEAKKRSGLYAGLQNLEGKTRRRIQLLEKKYHDVVTFQGRPYLDKMKVDCTEMLYWLQQERRQQALEHSAANRELNQITDLPVAELPELLSVTATV